MPDYTVKQGDCISSIAQEHGLFWDKVWNHPKNANLQERRKDPNVLFPGDVVFVPDKEEKEEPGATEQRHRFKKKGVPEKLQIRLLDEQDKPRSNLEYVIDIDGTLYKGFTNGDGWVRWPIPPNAQKGKLTIKGNREKEEYELRLGHLDPIDQNSGVQQRLKNLGFECGQVDGVVGPQTQEAIRAFQAKHKLEETGELNEATREKLKSEHGS
ncbi:MAG: peptidoglycan-binding protein [Deltaproteobacteria bacterium]|nr:peptidoglycan-binding protein [Deltaproteobacteria bacterium]